MNNLLFKSDFPACFICHSEKWRNLLTEKDFSFQTRLPKASAVGITSWALREMTDLIFCHLDDRRDLFKQRDFSSHTRLPKASAVGITSWALREMTVC